MSRAQPLTLEAADKPVLQEWVRATSGPAGLAQRARIVLLAAEGESNAEVGRLVGVSVPTVRSWRERYLTGGLDALADLPRPGRPQQVTREAAPLFSPDQVFDRLDPLERGRFTTARRDRR